MTKILILGSEGFIGSHLIKFYTEKKWEVHGADLYEVGSKAYNYHKISRLSPEFEELLKDTEFNYCINAAGSGNVTYSMTHPINDFEANSLDTMRLLDSIRRFCPECKYLHISSAAVYGNPKKMPIKEEDETFPLSPYGWHKLISEKICMEFSSIFNLKIAIVRPFSVYGPGLKKQLFWDLYTKVNAAKDSEIIELWGTGNESRDFIFIDDLVEAFNCILENATFTIDIFNVASGLETSISTIVNFFKQEVEKKVNFSFNLQTRSGDPLNWRADITKLHGIGFKNKILPQEGIRQTIQWLTTLN